MQNFSAPDALGRTKLITMKEKDPSWAYLITLTMYHYMYTAGGGMHRRGGM